MMRWCDDVMDVMDVMMWWMWWCDDVKDVMDVMMRWCDDVKLKSFTLWIDSSLCCASFRMTTFCFYSRLGSCIIGELFLNAKIFLSSLCFKVAKLAKFIRHEAVWKVCLFFFHKIHGDEVKWLCLWGHWGTSEMFLLWGIVVKM